MPSDFPSFLAEATQKAITEFIEAVEGLPEDRRGWSALDKGRTALDQAAECALLNGTTAQVLENRAWPGDYSLEGYQREKAELVAQGWGGIKALLQENTARVIAAIRAVPKDAWDSQIEMPWGKMPLSEIMAYPYWNMTYHLGQTNFIDSLT